MALALSGFVLLYGTPASAAPTQLTLRSARSELVTVELRSPVTLDTDRVELRSATASVFYFRRVGGGPSGGVAAFPEWGDADSVVLGESRPRLPAGRYEFSILTAKGSQLRLPRTSTAIRVLRRRPLGAPRVVTADLAGPGGLPVGHWQHPTTVQPGTLVLAALRAEFTSPVAAETMEVCVAPQGIPCAGQEGYGVSYANTRTAPVEETVQLIYEELPATTSNRVAQATVAGIDVMTSARVVLFSGPLR